MQKKSVLRLWLTRNVYCMTVETELLYWHVHIVVSIKIHMTGINECTGILIDSSVHRLNGYAGISVLGINRESSLQACLRV